MSIRWTILISSLCLSNKVLAFTPTFFNMPFIHIQKCCGELEIFDGNKNCIAAKGDEKDGFQNFLKKILGDYSSWEDLTTSYEMDPLGPTSDYTVYEDDFEVFYPFVTVCKKYWLFKFVRKDCISLEIKFYLFKLFYNLCFKK